MNTTIRHTLLTGAAFLLTLPLLFSQTPPPSPITITPTLVSVQLGQPLYCAARWTKPNIQVYCYTSSPGHTWDLLIYNSIFTANGTLTIPYVVNCLPGTPSCTSDGIMWIFSPDKTTAGVVDWQVAYNGAGMATGKFQ